MFTRYFQYDIQAPRMVKYLLLSSFLISFLNFAFYNVCAYYVQDSVLVTIGYATSGFSLAIALCVAFVVMWSNRYGKVLQVPKFLNKADWIGRECVLDIGCASGLITIAAAKRLQAPGKVIALDVVNKHDARAHALQVLYKNIKQEGLLGSIEVLQADARALPCKDASFDIVISNLFLHTLLTAHDRENVLDEMVRVVKPRGYILIQDIFYTHQYHAYLQKKQLLHLEISPLQWLIFPPVRMVIARKV